MAIDAKKNSVGVVGLNVMGCRIIACLLMAGHKVVAVASVPNQMIFAESQIVEYFLLAKQSNHNSVPEHYLKNLLITENYSILKSCKLVIECTADRIEVKKAVYSKIESEIKDDTILVTNTPGLAIDDLQKLSRRPDRFFGLFWIEPLYMSGPPKVVRGQKSNLEMGNFLTVFSRLWGKGSADRTSQQSKYAAYREHLIFLKSHQHPR